MATPFNEANTAFAPDGWWLAYSSDESGTYEVYVRPFPGPGERWSVSAGGVRYPLWSRDGRELIFQALDGRVMDVSFSATGASFAAGKPRVWTESRLRYSAFGLSYDIAPDGRRLAAILAHDANSAKLPTHLTFLLNFLDALRQKPPEGNYAFSETSLRKSGPFGAA